LFVALLEGKRMKRVRHDLNFLTSTGLLAATLVSALSGVVAHLWDLNDFWYHTYSSYVMSAFAIAHVWINWSRLVGYAKFRLVHKRSTAQPTNAAMSPRAARTARPQQVPSTALAVRSEQVVGQTLLRTVVSRRGMLGIALGGVGGWVTGQGLRQPPPIPQGSDLGVVYHQWSKPGVIDVLGTVANWGEQPALYKTYPDAPQIKLPTPRLDGGVATETAIQNRRSVRSYVDAPMTLDELSRVLFLMGGISTDRWGNAVRNAPSSGALYPIEAYAVVHNVVGLAPGVYHYGVQHHTLAQIKSADLRDTVVQQGLQQAFLGQCNVVIFLTMIMQRMRPKYQDRSYRYGLIEAGHLGQNIYLAATSMGLGACAIGAYMDDAINDMLGIDGVEEFSVYMLSVGKV
jgi:SagB-type dehydrogenase family enzyme